MHELVIVGGFFNSFVIALCFQRDSKLTVQIVHYLYIVVLIWDNLEEKDMTGIGTWIFLGLIISGFIAMSSIVFKIYNHVFNDLFEEYGRIDQLNRTL